MIRQSPTALARQALIDITVIATLIDAALTALHNGQAGLPETTPGAGPVSSGGDRECPRKDCTRSAPCPTHDPDGAIHLTATERLGTTRDPATHDLASLSNDIRLMAHHATRAARLAHQWGLPGINDTDVKTKLQERVAEIWCTNCAKAGISTVKRVGRTECAFCEAFRNGGACGVNNPNNLPAPKPLLDVHFHRRLNSGDVMRTMTATHGPNWNRKINTKKKGKAA